MEFDMVDNAALGTVIKVVGVGGAGGNAVQHMINKGVSGVEFIAANTDAQALAVSSANNIIQIGDSGLGAGMRPEVGRQLAEQSRSRIEDALRGAHMVFIAAGMGGGTGTGAAPIVAEVAKTMGALTVAVVSKPFSYEGQKCMDVAEEGLEELTKHVDSLIVILNEKLEDIYEDESMLDWMKHADDVLNNAVAGIAEIINVPGHINVDFNDVKTIMGEQGKAMMGTATAAGVDRARIAAEQAVASPLLDGIDLSGAKGVLVNVTASRGLKGKEIKEVMAAVRAFAAPDASIAQGIAYDDAMGDEIRVTVVATGLGKNKKSIQLVQPQQQLRTGTYDAPVMQGAAAVAGGLTAGKASADALGGMKQPAVWRREQASEQVQAMQRNGVETYDIPAFLRKQAD
ncbi:cell division protein FtsZ [Massilia oculi]|jgi:cell division protein FtsZ|uniref:Cell division protein FtsZ n=3 Tax=Massilia TaxID=149698 RepID=K9DRY7_9BURK|nr:MULTISPECIES: cell division protein FtsZ [Massilia]AWL04546.1 cell division protein FtsZ [Massilia oculi]EKU81477.1 cell division protein FtsZ [Massilia timonae CCUG 45783]OIJ43495.1 cell division protein FtsZ [Massilia timonae]QYG01286.1 cell division protein FtsZ [Massilia sp. NP310]HAK92497.1 cell division protein FtsZ [Massilia timonae]